MPASPGPNLGDRPHGTVTPADVAEWEARTYGRLARFAPPAPGAVVLDDVLPELDDMLADPDEAAAAIVDELEL
jgi:hypothetical protein